MPFHSLHPKWMVFLREIPLEIDDLGTPILGNLHGPYFLDHFPNVNSLLGDLRSSLPEQHEDTVMWTWQNELKNDGSFWSS